MGDLFRRILIKGVVQGVGFRPFIYRLATNLNLVGSIRNTPDGVEIVLPDQKSKHFLDQMTQNLPPLARVDQIIDQGCVDFQQETNRFLIVETTEGASGTCISPDTAICDDCLIELFDPGSRYYHYPFVNCTNCGPRYSVVTTMPYDRPKTTLVDFPLCLACSSSYKDPLNRRFHAEASACGECGSSLSHRLSDIASRIQEGDIIALKGNGGYHLICDAKNQEAVRRLRARKRRLSKPFALMALNVASIRQYCQVSSYEQAQLEQASAPIVLLAQKQNHGLFEAVNPGLNRLGFMLPSIPLHLMLFYYLCDRPEGAKWLSQLSDPVLVVTSANFSGGSIIADDDLADEVLTQIADVVVKHDRSIAMRCDDSVVAVYEQNPLIIRRAKGFTPEVIRLSESLPRALGLGGLLKNTFCFIDGDKASLSQHIGDLDTVYSIDYFHEVLAHFQHSFGFKFEVVAIDKHPDFYQSQFVESLNVPIIAVQHHEAHMASVMAEHGLKGDVLGLIVDGYGYGHHGEALGGELVIGNAERARFHNVGQLYPMPVTAGASLAQEPWRMAMLLCQNLGLLIPSHLMKHSLSQSFLSLIKTMDTSQTTTSCGRLFDVISSLLDICHINMYEGQAAMELEAMADRDIGSIDESVCYNIDEDNRLDVSTLVKKICVMAHKQPLSLRQKCRGASLFHSHFSKALAAWVCETAQKNSIHQVVISGGCFQNRRLLSGFLKAMRYHGLECFRSQAVPTNDGGISLGQAWVAAKRYKHQQQEVDYVSGNSGTDSGNKTG
ncbi:MAG: carbamoyltransferase HypF [Francisellaceae bacterium]